MNVCEINKFIDMTNSMDCYQFHPINEEVTISKGQDRVVIDLNLSSDEQVSLFEDFLLLLFVGESN